MVAEVGMKRVELDQSGADWHRWRSEGIGGSDAGVLMGTNPWTTEDQLAAVKDGVLAVEENERMARGKRLEPLARERYTEFTGIHVRPVCVVHDKVPWLRASLDGLSEDGRIVLEIKCPSDYAHKKALRGRIPDYYYPQVQHQLLVTGCPELHYFSFTDNEDFSPDKRHALVKIFPDEEYQEKLFYKEWGFVKSRMKKAA